VDNLHFIIKGSDLNDKKVGKAISLSADKYCSASIISLSKYSILLFLEFK
jgi:putative redox protein